jgi:hypothetical protein
LAIRRSSSWFRVLNRFVFRERVVDSLAGGGLPKTTIGGRRILSGVDLLQRYCSGTSSAVVGPPLLEDLPVAGRS